MSANDYPVEEHELRRAADSLHAFNYTSDANTVESALIELLALRARVAELESMNKMLCGKLDDQRRALWDPCAPYLKDGETPAQCIVRNRRDVDTAMASMVRDRDDALRYRWLRIVDGNQWGVLGLTDPDGLDAAIDAARATSNKDPQRNEGE